MSMGTFLSWKITAMDEIPVSMTAAKTSGIKKHKIIFQGEVLQNCKASPSVLKAI